MNLLKPIVLFLVLSLIVKSATGQNTEPASLYEFVSKEQRFGRYAILLTDEPSLALDPLLLEATFQRTPLEQIAENILGKDYSVQELKLGSEIQLGRQQGTSQRAFVEIFFDGVIPNEQAHQIWRAVVDDFSERLSDAIARIEKHRLAARQNRVNRIRMKIDSAIQQVEHESEMVHELDSRQSPLLSDQLRERMQQLSQRIRELEMNRLAWEARREAIENQVAELRGAADDAPKQNSVLRELARLEELKKEQLAIIQKNHEAGEAMTATVVRAQADVAEARIKYLQEWRSQIDPGLSNRISSLNARLADGMIELAEERRMQGELENQLDITEKQLNLMLHGSTEKEIAQIRLGFAKQMLSQLFGELYALKAESLEPATVTVIPWLE